MARAKMPPAIKIKWATQHIFQPCKAATLVASVASETAIVTTARGKASRRGPKGQDRGPQVYAAQAPPLHESVELTPGGRRKHTLTRASPGGTTRTATYTSPTKADLGIEVWDSDDSDCRNEYAMERWCARERALRVVPGQLSDAQRCSKARAKRAAGVPAAPRAKKRVPLSESS